MLMEIALFATENSLRNKVSSIQATEEKVSKGEKTAT